VLKAGIPGIRYMKAKINRSINKLLLLKHETAMELIQLAIDSRHIKEIKLKGRDFFAEK